MKQLKSLFAIITAVLFATLLGCASTSTKEGTGEYIDDSVITTKVKAAVLNEPTLKVAEINVETFKGVVQLSGFVKDAADVSKAAEVARNVKGAATRRRGHGHRQAAVPRARTASPAHAASVRGIREWDVIEGT